MMDPKNWTAKKGDYANPALGAIEFQTRLRMFFSCLWASLRSPFGTQISLSCLQIEGPAHRYHKGFIFSHVSLPYRTAFRESLRSTE